MCSATQSFSTISGLQGESCYFTVMVALYPSRILPTLMDLKSLWFSKQAMTNILSLAKVKIEYQVSYDGDDFIFNCDKHGYTDMVFKLHPSGLHVFDKDDPRGLASYSIIATLEENMSLFIKRQLVSADLNRNLQARLAYPSVKDLKWIVQANMLKDSPVTTQDVDVALKIWGPSVDLLKVKTVCRKP
jgi:hypothetical protein